MSIFKTAIVGAAALSMVLTGTSAIAKSSRVAAPAVSSVTAKKLKLLRSVAPSSRQSREVSGTDVGIGLLAATAAGVGLYFATKGDDSPGA